MNIWIYGTFEHPFVLLPQTVQKSHKVTNGPNLPKCENVGTIKGTISKGSLQKKEKVKVASCYCVKITLHTAYFTRDLYRWGPPRMKNDE